MDGAFAVLTNGEHEGRRGVNRLVEQALGDRSPQAEGYLPGLAAGGVRFRIALVPRPSAFRRPNGFLAEPWSDANPVMELLPACFLMCVLGLAEVPMPLCWIRVSPTINLNGIFSLVPADVTCQQLRMMLSG